MTHIVYEPLNPVPFAMERRDEIQNALANIDALKIATTSPTLIAALDAERAALLAELATL